MSESTRRLLLVEDNPGDARLIREMLIEAGDDEYALIHTSSIGGAGTLIESRPDAILLDLSLPDGQGLETLDCVKELAGDIPIIVLTGFGSDATAIRAVQEGAQDYLVKGEFGARALVRAVRYAIERSRAERTDRERRSLQDALEAMEKLLGVLGHELRTPLTSLRLLSEYMLSDTGGAESQWERYLKSINGEVIRMTDLVNNLLEAARLDSGISTWNWCVVDVRAVCRDALELLRPLVPADSVVLGCQVNPPGLELRGDPDGIRRLVVNLVNNAIRYTPSGRIDVLADETEENGVRWVRLAVRDTGTGIAEQASERLGVAFANNSGSVNAGESGGTGLGLAICKGIAAAHGGSISVASTPGAGTTFTVRLRAGLAGPARVPNDLRIIREAAA